MASSKYDFSKTTNESINKFAYQFKLLRDIGKALEGTLNSKEFEEGLMIGIQIGAVYILNKGFIYLTTLKWHNSKILFLV